jgi:hypothetical protein
VLQPPSCWRRTHPCFVHQRRQIIVLVFSNRNNDADRHQGDADDIVKRIPAHSVSSWESRRRTKPAVSTASQLLCRGWIGGYANSWVQLTDLRSRDCSIKMQRSTIAINNGSYVGVGSAVMPTHGSS